MATGNFLTTHALRGAFFATQLDQLAELIAVQGEALLQNSGIHIPSRAVSTALLIGERGKISAADIAEELKQPHQLVTQRIELLISAGIVNRLPDPDDGRRKTLQLTDTGIVQFEKLKQSLGDIERIFGDLFEEIDCDLPSVILKTSEALDQSSLSMRRKPT